MPPPVIPLVVCTCGAVLLACAAPDCYAVHTVRTVEACRVCTATGGTPPAPVREAEP